jgi:hypothetical protein
MTMLLLMVSFVTSGQRIDIIKTILKTKNFKKIESCLKKYKSERKRPVEFTYRESLNREIISSFTECAFVFTEFHWDNEGVEGTSESYQLNLITFNGQIVYYKIGSGSFDLHSSTISDTKDEYSNEETLKTLKNQYLNFFNRDLAIEDLFKNDIAYGFGCGIAGTPPEQREQLKKLVEQKDIKTLDSWLISPTTELQIYAIDGFFQLKESGYKLTVEELAWINFVKKKRGKAYTCGGCSYMNWPIMKIASKFVF